MGSHVFRELNGPDSSNFDKITLKQNVMNEPKNTGKSYGYADNLDQ